MSNDFEELDEMLESHLEVETDLGEIRLPTLAEARDPLAWAYDVQMVYSCIGSAFDIEGYTPTAGQRELHRWASDPGNRKEFMGMVKNAADAISKHDSNKTSDQVKEFENRGIRELQQYLREAVEASANADTQRVIERIEFNKPEEPTVEDILA